MINGIGKKAADGEENISVDDQVAALRDKGRDPPAFIGNVDPDSLKMTPTDRKFYGEWEWHTDMSYIPMPPTFSLLHARIVPATGGDTGFCSQVLAAAALPDDLRGEVSTLRIKHDATYTSSGVLRPGMSAPASPIEAHGHAHPVLRATPSGPALFLAAHPRLCRRPAPRRKRRVAQSAMGARHPRGVPVSPSLAGRPGGRLGQSADVAYASSRR